MTSIKQNSPMGEMNSTPLIDVMLVLLIMFIITIPANDHAVKIDMPMAGHDSIDPVINKVVILADSRILWNGVAVSLDQLDDYLRQSNSLSPSPELQFQPAPDARYDIVDFALARIKAADVEKLGFVGNEQYFKFDKAKIAPR